MTAERWERVKTLFDLALELPAGERSAWIQLNAQDREVAEEATRLLREHEAAAGDFLNNLTQEPATLLDRAARVLAESIHEPVLPRALLAGRYEIIRELGSGGAGIVYLAHDRVLHNRPVVLKFLFSGGESQERLSRRLQQEIQALARIRHPGVVGALDVGSTPDGRMFLVMEYVGGATLRACLNQPLSRRQVADLIEKIADALTAAHQAGVLHRDLKPENVMLESDYQSVKLIDFGIAKVRYSEPGATTHTVTFAGTINYIAPEQLMGKASVASDIYALGIIAYEMLTGRRPFDPETPFDLYELQKTGRIVPPTGLRADLASAVDRAILRALSFDPQKRQATPREFAREISAALGRRPLLRHRTLRHRTRWIAAGAAVVMCLGVASWNRNGIVRRSACDAFGDGWYLCPGPTISTVAGASPAALGHLYGVAADRKGNIYFSSTGKDQVYRLTIGPPLRVALVAGTGQRGFEGDGGDARFAQFDNPIALAVDGNDDLFVVDQHNFRIRKITFNDGIIRTVAGTGAAGSSGDGGPPGKATFRVPSALAFNSEGTLFVADYGASCVRAIRFGANPVITTPVGGVNGFSGDGGDPKQAQLSGPAGLGFDASGSLFIADQHNNRVRKVTFGSNPKITTVAGAGRASFDGDGGVPTQAGLSGPNGLALDRFGNLYIADSENHRIRKVTFGSKPQIRTVVGNGLAGFSGDGGPASAARLSLPNAMAITTNGDIYVADYLNDRIRRVTQAVTASH
jgi:predicted Ser/Thr protein kinase